MRIFRTVLTAISAVVLVHAAAPSRGEEARKIDASDPTRIYTFVGVGPKYTRYANGEHMWEMRVSGNIGLSKQDMVFFNVGYGRHFGNSVAGANSGVTNGRMRWFHLFEMDYSVTDGYRGWATQVDVQVGGGLKGTNGQSVVSLGALPAWGLNRKWSLFLPVNLVNAFDRDFKTHRGMGFNVSPLLVYVPGNWWNGAYVQFWPGYTRFFSGGRRGRGGTNLDITLGGKISERVTWTLLTGFVA